MHDLSRRDAPATRPVARRLTVAGRVQGVSFRWSLRREAARRGVHGWVRNTPAGGVEAWLEGAADAVEATEVWVRAGGPPAAEVTAVDAAPEQPAGFDRFEIRR